MMHGINGTRKIIEFLTYNKVFSIYVALIPKGKDVNDLTQDEFKDVEVIPYYKWIKFIT